jgi:hypothetical protein
MRLQALVFDSRVSPQAARPMRVSSFLRQSWKNSGGLPSKAANELEKKNGWQICHASRS